MRTAKELKTEEMNMVNGGLILLYNDYISVTTDDEKKVIKVFTINSDDPMERASRFYEAVYCADQNGVSRCYKKG